MGRHLLSAAGKLENTNPFLLQKRKQDRQGVRIDNACEYTQEMRAETTPHVGCFLAILIKIAVDWYIMFAPPSWLTIIIFYFII